MAKQIFIAVTNDLCNDQRVYRVAQSLSNSGHKVRLIGRALPGSANIDFPFQSHRFRLSVNAGAGFYALYNIRLFFYLLFHRFDAILANDLDTLPACFIASRLKRKTIIYDSHEYFTEVPELIGRDFQKNVWLGIENRIVPKLKYTYTVSGSIATIYNKLYGTNFQVIRNLPLKKKHGEHAKKNVLMYQGVLNTGRGIDLMIQAMLYLPDFELWIAGSGDVEQDLKELCVNLALENRVKFLGKLASKNLHEITEQALVGLSLEENLGLNYYYALPNKLFDYFQACLPVIVSDLPEMRAVVETYKTGKVLSNRTPIALANLIKDLTGNKIVYDKLKKNTEIAANELCWENEEPKLVAIFNEALKTC